MSANKSSFGVKSVAVAFVTLFLSVFTVQQGLGDSISAKPTFKKVYRQEALKAASSHEWISFQLHLKRCSADTDSLILEADMMVTVRYDAKNQIIFLQNRTSNNFYYFDPNTYKKIDMHNRDILDISKTGKKGKEAYRELGEFGFIPSYFSDIPFYLIPMQHFNKTFILLPFRYSSTEETLNGETFVTTTHNMRNATLVSTINATTHLLQRATNTNTNYKTEYVFSEYDFGDRSKLIDSIFNFDDTKYSQFTQRYGGREGTTNTELNEEIAAYPIVGMHQDTTTINQAEDWVLLNFWSFNCGPCIENLKKIGMEKKEAGERVLEKEGISIYAINHRSDNLEKIKEMGEKTNTSDIMYSAKNMGNVISIPFLGYYYLISPDKQIVYETGNLGDYSELLEAKANYEKQRKSK